MTRQSENVVVERKIVLFFDICSSTSILEELNRTENQLLWRNLLIGVKKYLKSKYRKMDFEIYKFIGDGWILLFEPRREGLEILTFIRELSAKFISLYNRQIKDVLTIRIQNIGLTFGMDIGSCIRLIMNQRPEYTGRPLVVAARLQGAIEQRDKRPQNKMLISNNLYATFSDRRSIEEKFKITPVQRNLKNIFGGENYECKKIKLSRKAIAN
ncbi:MAG: hypothetical protein AB1424_18800 [Thermodesulfobacteriota bacterium]